MEYRSKIETILTKITDQLKGEFDPIGNAPLKVSKLVLNLRPPSSSAADINQYKELI